MERPAACITCFRNYKGYRPLRKHSFRYALIHTTAPHALMRPFGVLWALCAFALCGVSMTLAPPTVRLGDFVIQRAIQQQLYFIAELKNAPVGTWLAQFEGHEHLESIGRKPGAPGNPGSYSAEFGQLRTPYTAYLSALGDAPVEYTQVECSQPRRKLSARELQNPFLVKEEAERAAVKEYRDVPIVPQQILSHLLTTADVIADTWAFHLGELGADDAARVAMDRAPTKALLTPEMLRDSLLASEGGETAISWYTEDEPLPLHALDHRACDRLVTLRALKSLVVRPVAFEPTLSQPCHLAPHTHSPCELQAAARPIPTLSSFYANLRIPKPT